MRVNSLCCSALLGLLLAAPAAAQTIDQNQPISDTPYSIAGFYQVDLAQSFIQSSSNIAGAGILLHAGYGTSGMISISLWDMLPNASGASMLASSSAAGTAGSWVDVFWSAVGVTSGATYYLAFESTASDLRIAGSTENPYVDGQAYANNGYDPYPTFDYAFRTYASEVTAVVPEPGIWLLLGSGLLGLGFVAVRRRRDDELAA